MLLSYIMHQMNEQFMESGFWIELIWKKNTFMITLLNYLHGSIKSKSACFEFAIIFFLG